VFGSGARILGNTCIYTDIYIYPYIYILTTRKPLRMHFSFGRTWFDLPTKTSSGFPSLAICISMNHSLKCMIVELLIIFYFWLGVGGGGGGLSEKSKNCPVHFHVTV